MTTLDGDVDPLTRALGVRVRRLRRARGLTLVGLAGLADLSHPFLSKLERGLTRPSMASLAKIARALGTSQVELLAGADADDAAPSAPTAPSTQVVRAGEGVTGPYGLGRARLLAGGARRMQPMECWGDNDDPGDYFAHDEDEFLVVTAGAVTVDMAGHGTTTLGVGESIYLDGGVPHRWSSAAPGGDRMLVVKERPPGR